MGGILMQKVVIVVEEVGVGCVCSMRIKVEI